MNSAPVEATSQHPTEESSYKACFLIPCFNHGATMPTVVSSLHHFELPIIIVDDGSELTTKQFLAPLAEHSHVTLVTLDQNQGKGGAVKAGIKKHTNSALATPFKLMLTDNTTLKPYQH